MGNIAGKFQAFDYGDEKRNLEEYGRATPPSYSLSKVTIPVGLFWAENDSDVVPEVTNNPSLIPFIQTKMLSIYTPVHQFQGIL